MYQWMKRIGKAERLNLHPSSLVVAWCPLVLLSQIEVCVYQVIYPLKQVGYCSIIIDYVQNFIQLDFPQKSFDPVKHFNGISKEEQFDSFTSKTKNAFKDRANESKTFIKTLEEKLKLVI